MVRCRVRFGSGFVAGVDNEVRLEVDEKEKPLGCESSQIPMHVTLSFMMEVLLCWVTNDDDDGNGDGKNNNGNNDGNCTFVA